MEDFFNYQKTNRQKRMTPRLVKWWCIGCDMLLVSPGKKCKHCGNISTRKTILKKEPLI